MREVAEADRGRQLARHPGRPEEEGAPRGRQVARHPRAPPLEAGAAGGPELPVVLYPADNRDQEEMAYSLL